MKGVMIKGKVNNLKDEPLVVNRNGSQKKQVEGIDSRRLTKQESQKKKCK